MHYTLLPEAEHKLIHGEYHVRVIIVFCFVMAIVGLIGMVALFPAYMSARMTESSEERTANAVNAQGNKSLNLIKTELSNDASILSYVRPYTQQLAFSKIIADVTGVRGPVSIASLSLQSTLLSGSTPSSGSASSSIMIILQGVAPTRASLLSFKSRLEALQKGNTVDLPISELTKSVSVQFSIKLIENI